MNCREVRDELKRIEAGKAAGTEFLKHVKACKGCAAEYSLAMDIKAAFKAEEKIKAPADFNAKVWEKLGQKPVYDFSFSFFARQAAYAAAALLFIVVIHDNISDSGKKIAPAAYTKVIINKKLPQAVKPIPAQEQQQAQPSQMAKQEVLPEGTGKAPVKEVSQPSFAKVSTEAVFTQPGTQGSANQKPAVSSAAFDNPKKIKITPTPTIPLIDGKYMIMKNVFKPLQGERLVLKYKIEAAYRAKITVYNRMGQPIIDLINDEKQPGIHEISWDGRDKLGRTCADGIYIIHIKTDIADIKEKAALVK